MEFFVDKNSVVREIWGKGDTVLFIFAGSSAEFALNKAVDWLYYTGRLPADPLGRLFSTVSYARQIVFSNLSDANKSIDKITAIHTAVEASRGSSIPDWAYRDVLFMLIYYSIAAYEVMERRLMITEKEEVYNVFFRVGSRMGLKQLPADYNEWLIMREDHLEQNLEKGLYTIDLYKQYKKHLGSFRYNLLLQSQALVVPAKVSSLLQLGKAPGLKLLLPLYKASRRLNLGWFFKSIILPGQYKAQIKDLDIIPD